MPPKKRTSAAEKLTILRRIIVEGKCSWNLKELEKAGSKAGIVTQAIKDVLQSLCDDNLVDQDKIGSGSFFWSFASKNQLKLEHRIKKLLEEQAQLEAAKAELEARAEAASATRNAAVCILCARAFCFAHWPTQTSEILGNMVVFSTLFHSFLSSNNIFLFL